MVCDSADTSFRVVGVVSVDDHALFRGAVRAVVDATPGFTFLGEAARGEDGVSLAAQLHPDLMVVDVRMPGISGLETGARLARLSPRPFVVLVSADDDPRLPELALAHGAIAFLPKRALRPRTLQTLWQLRDHAHPADHANPPPDSTAAYGARGDSDGHP